MTTDVEAAPIIKSGWCKTRRLHRHICRKALPRECHYNGARSDADQQLFFHAGPFKFPGYSGFLAYGCWLRLAILVKAARGWKKEHSQCKIGTKADVAQWVGLVVSFLSHS